MHALASAASNTATRDHIFGWIAATVSVLWVLGLIFSARFRASNKSLPGGRIFTIGCCAVGILGGLFFALR